MVDIDTLKNLERLEALVEDCPKMLGLFRFDDEEFYTLVNKIRASLPEDLRRAGKITQQSDRIMEQAQAESEQVIEAARAEGAKLVQESRAKAQSMIDQSEIVQISRAQAREIISQAENEAREVRGQAEAEAQAMRTQADAEAHAVRHGADEYARDVLVSLEQQVTDVLAQIEGRVSGMLNTIQRGRQKLEQRVERSAASAPTPATSATRVALERREPLEVGAPRPGGSAGTPPNANGRI